MDLLDSRIYTPAVCKIRCCLPVSKQAVSLSISCTFGPDGQPNLTHDILQTKLHECSLNVSSHSEEVILDPFQLTFS